MMYNYSCLGNKKAAFVAVWNNTQTSYNYISPFAGVAVFPRQEPLTLRRVFLFGEQSQVKSGIYQIYNTKTHLRYIGSSNNLQRRWPEHLRDLKKNRHQNPRLQNSFNLHGIEAFEFKVIEFTDPDSRLEREQCWIDYFGMSSLYNLNPLAVNPPSQKGVSPSPETREKLSKALKGRVISPEARAKVSELNQGRKHTQESRANMSTAQKGKVLSQETRDKMSKVRLGIPKPPGHAENTAMAKRRPIEQVDPITGEVVARFEGADVAQSSTGISKGNIGEVARGKRKRAGGFCWRYANKKV